MGSRMFPAYTHVICSQFGYSWVCHVAINQLKVVVVSKLSELLNERNREGWSAREIGRRAESKGKVLSQANAVLLLSGKHAKRPKLETLEAVAAVLPVTVEEMREALGFRPDPGQPWVPPDEARLLTDDQRAALSQLIKTIVVDDLIRELTGGQKDAGDTEVEKTSNEGVRPNVTPETQTLAARRGDSRGKHQAHFTDQLGQEPQDDGGWEPA